MAIPNIPQYFIGKNIAVIGVSSITVDNVTGVATVGTGVDYKSLAIWDSCEVSLTPNLIEIHPGDAEWMNNVPGVRDFDITLTDIVKANGQSQNILLASSYDYVRVEFQPRARGGAAYSGYTFVAIGTLGGVSWSYSEQSSRARVSLKPCSVAPFYGTGTPPI